jgi:hypothetical protein
VEGIYYVWIGPMCPGDWVYSEDINEEVYYAPYRAYYVEHFFNGTVERFGETDDYSFAENRKYDKICYSRKEVEQFIKSYK